MTTNDSRRNGSVALGSTDRGSAKQDAAGIHDMIVRDVSGRSQVRTAWRGPQRHPDAASSVLYGESRMKYAKRCL